MLKRGLIFFLLIGYWILYEPGLSPALAQFTLQVQSNEATLDYPQAVTFQLIVSNQDLIEQAYLIYGTSARTCTPGIGRQTIDLEPGRYQTLEWTWDLYQSNNLPPGAEIWWQWELHNTSGVISRTDKRTLVVEDPNYKWYQVSKADLSIYWTAGKESFGSALLEIASRSLERLEKNAGVRPEGNIRLTIYPDTQTLLEAALNLPGWAGGVAFPEYGSVLIAIPAGSTTWASHVIPHELAHLVTEAQIFNCMGIRMPTWLSEGLSVYAEGDAPRRDLSTMKEAFTKDEVPDLRSLAYGFSGDPEEANLSYIQSGQVVAYLIDAYGAEKMAALLDSLQYGKPIDRALSEVYGFDTDGLDAAWRTVQGYPKKETGDFAVQTTPVNTPIPTLALWTPEYQPPTSTNTPTMSPTSTQPPLATSTPPSRGAMLETMTQLVDGSLIPAWLPALAGIVVVTIVLLVFLRFLRRSRR